MKIKPLLIMLTISTTLLGVFLTGCADEGVSTIIREYNIEEATAIIDEVEWLTAWLSQEDSISRGNAGKLIDRFNETLDYQGENMLTLAMADASEWEDSEVQTISLGNEYIPPTIYHEGVAIVSATEEEKRQASDDKGEAIGYQSTLTIRKEYAGPEPKLQDWYLEYVFNKHGLEGKWSFVCFNGTYNVDVVLPLKESFAAAAPVFSAPPSSNLDLAS